MEDNILRKKLNKKKESFTVEDVTNVIEKAVPATLQEDWDNSGLLIGFEEKAVTKILTCLELDKRVVEEAKEIRADMIVTHHPLIFSGIKSLSAGDYKTSMIMDIIAEGISVYSCHTPFDKVKGGNNDIIMKRMGLSQIKNLTGDDVASPAKMAERQNEADIGRTGEFKEPLTYKQVIELAAERLDMSISSLHAAGSLNTEITKVGVCTGAGADLAHMAASCGCQLFITGDVKYHEAQDALQAGMCILDAGHYGTEKFFAEEMKNLLDKKLDDAVEVVASKVSLDPFVGM